MAEFEFPLEIKARLETLATRTIKWRPKKVQVEFTHPTIDVPELIGNSIMPIELTNTGEADIPLDELSIAFKFKEEPSGGKPSFYLEKKIASSYSTKLIDILTKKSDDTLKPNQTVSFNLKRYDNQYSYMDKPAYEMELQVQLKSKIIDTKNITVKKENIQVAFVAPAKDGELFTGTDPLTITLKNTGDDVSTDDLLVYLWSTAPDQLPMLTLSSMFTLEETFVGLQGEKLTAILNKGAFVLKQGSAVTFKLKRTNLNSHKKKAEMQVGVKYETDHIGSSKLITWNES